MCEFFFNLNWKRPPAPSIATPPNGSGSINKWVAFFFLYTQHLVWKTKNTLIYNVCELSIRKVITDSESVRPWISGARLEVTKNARRGVGLVLYERVELIHGNTVMVEWEARKLLEMKADHFGYYVLIANMYAAAGCWSKLAGSWLCLGWCWQWILMPLRFTPWWMDQMS